MTLGSLEGCAVECLSSSSVSLTSKCLHNFFGLGSLSLGLSCRIFKSDICLDLQAMDKFASLRSLAASAFDN